MLLRKIAVSAVIAACTSVVAYAEEFPSKSIRTVLPFASGGPTDAIGRVIATQMGTDLGQPIYIESKPGASGTLGASEVARAKGDGYTLLFGSRVTQITSPLINKVPVPTENRARAKMYSEAELAVPPRCSSA